MSNNHRELTGREKQQIKKLITSLCANHDKEYGCLPLDCECPMFGICYALTSEAFSAFISDNGIGEFYIAGADATACVKSTCFNMTKAGYTVHVISDCVTSYDLKKVDEMLDYYAKKGCEVKPLSKYMN